MIRAVILVMLALLLAPVAAFANHCHNAFKPLTRDDIVIIVNTDKQTREDGNIRIFNDAGTQLGNQVNLRIKKRNRLFLTAEDIFGRANVSLDNIDLGLAWIRIFQNDGDDYSVVVHQFPANPDGTPLDGPQIYETVCDNP